MEPLQAPARRLHHQLSAKHLPAYLVEFTFRYHNRHDDYLFRNTLMTLVGDPSLPYQESFSETG